MKKENNAFDEYNKGLSSLLRRQDFDTNENITNFVRSVLHKQWNHQQERINKLEAISSDRFKEMGRLQDGNCKYYIENKTLKEELEKLR